MSIEKQLEELTKAVTKLTQVMLSTTSNVKVSTGNQDTIDEDEDETPRKGKTKSDPKAGNGGRKTPTRQGKKAPIDDDEDDADDADDSDEFEDEDEEDEITATTVKKLAKDKISSGTDRNAIKKLITKLGAESIADLDAKGLAKLHTQLKAL